MSTEEKKVEEVDRAAPPETETVKVVAEEKPHAPEPAVAEKVEECKAEEKVVEKTSDGSSERDAELARVATEKRLSLIKAWEENRKARIENKAVKKLSSIDSWENTKKAQMEARLKAYEEDLEKKKAEGAEKLKNKLAAVHKRAEELKAAVEAKKGKKLLQAEEKATSFRARETVPKRIFGWFGP